MPMSVLSLLSSDRQEILPSPRLATQEMQAGLCACKHLGSVPLVPTALPNST